MPNHLHGIITILDEEDLQNDRQEPAGTVQRGRGKLAAGSLDTIVGRSKGSATIMTISYETRSHFEQYVEYIVMNPSRWADDSYFNENGSNLFRS